MNRRRTLRAASWYAGAPLLAVVAVAGLVVLLGSTVMSIEPAEPRDRDVPEIGAGLGPLRVTVLGTSLSSAGRYRWPDEVGSRLSAMLGRPVEVNRIAQPGANSEWGVEQVDRVLESNPDFVLIEFAVNDADVRSLMTPGRSAALHEQIITALNRTGRDPVVVLLTMNPAFGPRAWTRPFLNRYYAEYVDLAERYEIGLVDLYARWIASPDSELEIDDGLHPSDSVATRVIAAPIVNALASAAGAQA